MSNATRCAILFLLAIFTFNVSLGFLAVGILAIVSKNASIVTWLEMETIGTIVFLLLGFLCACVAKVGIEAAVEIIEKQLPQKEQEAA